MKKKLLTLCAIPLTELCEFTQEELAETICKWMNFLKKVLEAEQNLRVTSLECHLANHPGKALQLIVYLKVNGNQDIESRQQAGLDLEGRLLSPQERNLEELIDEDIARLSARRKELERAVSAAPSVTAEINTAAFFNEKGVIRAEDKKSLEVLNKFNKSKELKMLAAMVGQAELPGFNKVEWDPGCHRVRAFITRTERGYRAALIDSDVKVRDCKRFDLYRPFDAVIDDALNKAERERAAINLRIRVGRLFGDDCWSLGRVQAVES